MERKLFIVTRRDHIIGYFSNREAACDMVRDYQRLDLECSDRIDGPYRIEESVVWDRY